MTASAYATPAPLAAYLRRATWGLPRARQQELWDELEEHVLTRVDYLYVLGALPEQALSQALRELGPPARVSAGMTQVYLMPKLILTAAAAALTLSAALYALAGGGGGPTVALPVLNQRPSGVFCLRDAQMNADLKGIVIHEEIVSRKNGVTCYRPRTSSIPGAYIGLGDLKSALEVQGGRARFLTSTRLDVDLPGRGGGILVADFIQNGQGYAAADTLIAGLGTTQRVSVCGFDAPEVNIGNVRLKVGNGSQPGIGESFYQGLLVDLVDRLVIPNREEAHSLTVSYPSGKIATHTMQTGLNPGEVVMLVTQEGPHKYMGDIAPVQPDGTVRLLNPSHSLRFMTNPAQLTPNPSGGYVPALLVRVTNVPLNNLKQGILLPPHPTSDATH